MEWAIIGLLLKILEISFGIGLLSLFYAYFKTSVGQLQELRDC